MKKLPLLAIGAAALAVAGFSSAASAHDRVSFGIFLGGPPVAVEDPYYDSEAAYWAHRRWVEHERWEAYHRELDREHCEHERWRAEHAYYGRWHHDDDDDRD